MKYINISIFMIYLFIIWVMSKCKISLTEIYNLLIGLTDEYKKY